MLKAPQTKKSKGGAWTLAWAALLFFGAETPCLLAMNNDMTPLEYATGWYSIEPAERYQVVTMKVQAAAAGLPEGTNAFDVYTQQIAAGAPSNPQDIPAAIQAVAWLLDGSPAGATLTDNLYDKLNTQRQHMDSEPGDKSLVTLVENTHSDFFSSKGQSIFADLNSIMRYLIDKEVSTQNDSVLKRLEDIQGIEDDDQVRGGLIGSSNKKMNALKNCASKVNEITTRINAKIKKTDPTKPRYLRLAPAVNALDLLGDCSVFAGQIDARTPLKTIPKAVESVVGDFDSEGGSMNAYGLIGFLPGEVYPVTTKDIYRRLNNALTQLDEALDTHFGDSYTKSVTTPTLQAIIAKLAAI